MYGVSKMGLHPFLYHWDQISTLQLRLAVIKHNLRTLTLAEFLYTRNASCLSGALDSILCSQVVAEVADLLLPDLEINGCVELASHHCQYVCL